MNQTGTLKIIFSVVLPVSQNNDVKKGAWEDRSGGISLRSVYVYQIAMTMATPRIVTRGLEISSDM